MITATIGAIATIASIVLIITGVSAGNTLPMLCGTLLFPVALFICAFNLGRATKRLQIEVTDRTQRHNAPSGQEIDYSQIAAQVVSQLKATKRS
jgi:hypothetical protein